MPLPLFGPLCAGAMPVNPARQARRAFVRLLLSLAAKYGVAVTLTRDSPDAALTRAFKRVLLKAHPDTGGSVQDTQRLRGGGPTQ